MRGNRRVTKSITAVLLAVAVLLASWVLPVFAEGTAEAEADPTNSATQGTAGATAPEAEGTDDDLEEPDTGAGERGGKPDGASGDDAGKSNQADSVRSKPAQPLTLGASGFIAVSFTVSDTEVTVHLDNWGDLQTELDAVILDTGNTLTSVNEITKLTVTGWMDGSDMDYIWNNGAGVMLALEDLDMSGATITGMSGRLKANQFRMNNKLESIALPSGIEYIEDNVFHTCTALRSIDFSCATDLTGMGENVFENCTSLEHIDLSACAALLSIGESAFKGCTSLERVNLPDSVLSIDEYTFQGCTALTDVRFPSSLITIGDFAFQSSFQGGPASMDLSGCRELTTIGARAFYDCSELEQVTFPTGLASIKTGAFEGSGIQSADLSGNVNLTSLNREVFSNCRELRYIDLSGTGLTTIETNTFYLCDALETIVLPDGMTSIENYAFESCKSLRGITLPAGLRSIGDNAFDGCAALDKVDFSRCTDLASIGNNAFIGTAIQTINLSFCTGLTTIGSNAFAGCTRLYTMWLPNTGGVVVVDSSTFANRSTPVNVIVPTALLGSYQTDTNWGACKSAGEVALIGGWTVTVNQVTGGIIEVDSRTHLQNDTVTLTVDVSPGYTHTGWSTTPGSLNLSYQGTDTYAFTMPAQDVAVTPTFQIDPRTCSVTYHANGGTGTAPGAALVQAGSTHTIEKPTGLTPPNGKQFKEWNSRLDGTGTIHMPDDVITVNGNLDLYAIWENIPAASYTVTFDPSGGSVMPASMQTGAGGKLAYLPTPTHGGSYAFDGWYTMASGGTRVTIYDVYTSDTTIYARWSYTGGSSSRSGGGSSTPDSRTAKTTIPASAFSWDGRTLTISHDSITPLGLLSVRWDGVETKEYSVHQGSVIIRFHQDFLDKQSSGEHTVRVEFLNHTGEATVTLGSGGTENAGPNSGGPQNPTTGGADLHNPQTGDFSSPWRWLLALIPAAVLAFSSSALLWRRLRSCP